MELVIKEKYSDFIKIVSDNKEDSSEQVQNQTNISSQDLSQNEKNEFENIFLKLESIINSNTKRTDTNVITVVKPNKKNTKKNKKYNNNSSTDEKKQFEKLEILYDKQINNPNEINRTSKTKINLNLEYTQNKKSL